MELPVHFKLWSDERKLEWAEQNLTRGTGFQWVTTAPNPSSPATGVDAGQRGWVVHAVSVPRGTKLSAVRSTRSLCGLLPAHGWGLDLFIVRPCTRCIAALLKHA